MNRGCVHTFAKKRSTKSRLQREMLYEASIFALCYVSHYDHAIANRTKCGYIGVIFVLKFWTRRTKRLTHNNRSIGLMGWFVNILLPLVYFYKSSALIAGTASGPFSPHFLCCVEWLWCCDTYMWYICNPLWADLPAYCFQAMFWLPQWSLDSYLIFSWLISRELSARSTRSIFNCSCA